VAGAGRAVTGIRVEGPGPSVEHRCRELKKRLKGKGEVEELHSENSRTLWREIRDAALLGPADGRQVWRLSVPPMAGASAAGRLVHDLGGEAFYDWGGGLVWLAIATRPDAGHEAVRAAILRGRINEPYSCSWFMIAMLRPVPDVPNVQPLRSVQCLRRFKGSIACPEYVEGCNVQGRIRMGTCTF